MDYKFGNLQPGVDDVTQMFDKKILFLIRDLPPLSILFNAVLFVIIKLFAKFNIDALQALVVNYFVAFLVGLLFLEVDVVPQEIMNENWFKGSILLGFVFISTFMLPP